MCDKCQWGYIDRYPVEEQPKYSKDGTFGKFGQGIKEFAESKGWLITETEDLCPKCSDFEGREKIRLDREFFENYCRSMMDSFYERMRI